MLSASSIPLCSNAVDCLDAEIKLLRACCQKPHPAALEALIKLVVTRQLLDPSAAGERSSLLVDSCLELLRVGAARGWTGMNGKGYGWASRLCMAIGLPTHSQLCRFASIRARPAPAGLQVGIALPLCHECGGRLLHSHICPCPHIHPHRSSWGRTWRH